MKLHHLFTAAMIAGSSMLTFAQTYKDGVEYYRADQYRNAKELLERNYDSAGSDKCEVDYYLGMIALKEGKINDAKQYFEKGVNDNPEYPYSYVGLGELALKSGDVKTAENYFKTATSKAKKDPSVDIAVARAYYDVDPVAYSKKIDDSIAKATKNSPKEKISGAPTNVDIYLFEGDRLRDQKEWGKAGNMYQMATTYDAYAPEAYVKYADLFTDVNPKLVIELVKNLLEANPNSALGQKELANAYYENNNYKEAVEEYKKYVKNPNHFKRDEDRLAFLLFYDNKYQEGYDYASNLLKENPDNFSAMRFQFMNAAQIESMQDQLFPLAEALLAAHKSNPDNIFAPIDYNLVSDELSKGGKTEEAIALLQEGIAKEPTNRDYQKQLAMVYLNQEDYPKAADAYQNYITNSQNPGYNDWIQQASLAFYAGVEEAKTNPEAAAKYYDLANSSADNAAKIAPTYLRPYKIKGDVAKQTAPESKVGSVAVPIYTDALVIFEGNESPTDSDKNVAKEIYNYMGNYYLDQKDKATALQYFNKYLELDPNNEAYRKFVSGLK